MLEKEKELSLKAYQEQTDAENKRHEQRINNLNDELKLLRTLLPPVRVAGSSVF